MGQWLKERVVLGIISALVVAWTVTSPIDLAFGADSCSTDIPSNATTLSACLGDNFPAGTDVTIGPDGGAKCTRVKVDGSRTGTKALGKITIQQWGSLYFPDQTVELDTKGIDVSGLLQVGTATCPIGTTHSTNKVTITFTGSRPLSEDHTKGIVVQKNGRLLLYGARGVPGGTPDGVSWTHLSEAAGPPLKYGADTETVKLNIGRPVPGNGATTLQLAKDVATGAGAWQDGDWIAVATTSYSPFETEFVQINAPVSKGKDGSTVTLKSPQTLKYYHFGGLDPGPPSSANFNAGADKNYGVDERAEVGLISRNIKLTAKIESGDTNKHWGGEVRILNGFKDLDIQGVEIEKFGKDQLGSYPIHLHMAGDLTNTPPLINANSVHHSYNKCVTIHSTQKVTIQNMVCARIVGHIFYQEVGDEDGIKYSNNLGLGAMSHYFDINAPTPAQRDTMIKNFWWTGDNLTNDAASANFIGYDGLRVFNTDAQDNPTHGSCTNVKNTEGLVDLDGQVPCKAGQFYTEPASGFWIINPTTQLTNNSIGGCQGTGRGYWYVPPTCRMEANDNNKNYCASEKYKSITDKLTTLKFQPVGTFANNRVHGCWGGLLSETDGKVIVQEQLFPRAVPDPNNPKDPNKDVLIQDRQPLITVFDGITATRNRGRAVWLRPTWFAATNARLASNRINVTLVSSGGLDGNAPGVWGLLKDSVVVGWSENNVDRFGPCPLADPANEKLEEKGAGNSQGCIDQTPGSAHPSPTLPTAGDIIGDCCEGGYPTPRWNLMGYLIYDGPVRIFENHFVNFRKDPAASTDATGQKTTPLWTHDDQAFFSDYAKKRPMEKSSTFTYEGEPVFGWFDSNTSAYPTSTAVRGLTFTNVDFRHQIFTENVMRPEPGPTATTAAFNDGDKNTAVIDLDGSLTGLEAVNSSNQKVPGLKPISLNNLPFNASSNSVDECLAAGGQDDFYEKRSTSLISPGSMASLEFAALHPILWNPADHNPPPPLVRNHTQILTFKKDSKDFDEHASMALHGRNAQGTWEPKVTSGFGYTVAACASKKQADVPWKPRDQDTTCDTDENNKDSGIPTYVSVGITDPVKPGINPDDPKTWLSVRLGICYTDYKTGTASFPPDASKFKITRGFKSYNGSGGVGNASPGIREFWNKLESIYNGEVCIQLDTQDARNLCPDHPLCENKSQIGCPAHGVTSATKKEDCPFQKLLEKFENNQCIYKTTHLQQASSIDDLISKDIDKNPLGPALDWYFYDPSTGMLYFNVVQNMPNAEGPSPLGDCKADGSGRGDKLGLCPTLNKNPNEPESYYGCPAPGCTHYVVFLDAPGYLPGRSTCEPYPKYEQLEPANQDRLVLKGTTSPIQTKEVDETVFGRKFPHHTHMDPDTDKKICPITP